MEGTLSYNGYKFKSVDAWIRIEVYLYLSWYSNLPNFEQHLLLKSFLNLLVWRTTHWHNLRSTERTVFPAPPGLMPSLLGISIHPVRILYNDLLIFSHNRTRRNQDPLSNKFQCLKRKVSVMVHRWVDTAIERWHVGWDDSESITLGKGEIQIQPVPSYFVKVPW